MAETLPALRPACAQHGPMAIRPPETKEQEWCGVWYACTAPRCLTAHLLSSAELRASLAEQEAATAKPEQLALINPIA